MPSGRMPEGSVALSNAERQARYRAKRLAAQPPLTIKCAATARRSRSKRWNDALAEMIAVQGECAAWFEALPESLRDSATAAALQDISISIWTPSPRFSRPGDMAVTERCATTPCPQGGAACEPWQIVGPRHARPQTAAVRGSGPAASGGFDTARARPPGQWQVGTKEQAL